VLDGAEGNGKGSSMMLKDLPKIKKNGSKLEKLEKHNSAIQFRSSELLSKNPPKRVEIGFSNF
jgi:hypothetical protein